MANKNSKRHLIQALGTVAANGNIKGFIEGNIHTGSSKSICVPVLNCYSCPGAVGSCPIGSLQAVSGNPRFKISHYVLGLLVLFGILGGRFYCGYLCPFGFIQDLLYKIKSKKINHKIIPSFLKYTKYLILLIFVFLLPILITTPVGTSDPYFCKYICPAGTLTAGIPLLALNPMLRSAIGKLFYWKFFILAIIVIVAIFLYRPFCRFLCPLGAFYGPFNKISFYKFKINDSCISCRRCEKACEYNIYTKEEPNSPECIRCDKCIDACPTNAIEKTYLNKEISKMENLEKEIE